MIAALDVAWFGLHSWPWLGLLPLWWWLWRTQTARREAMLARELGPRGTVLLGVPAWSRTRQCLAAAACLLAGLALLQPVAGELPGAPFGADVVVCLDVSRSMRARDVAPDRLAAAAAQCEQLAAAAPQARLGLVVFAGDAVLRVPLSADGAAVAAIAAAADPSEVARGGSDPGAAIDLAAAALQRAGSRGGAIVLASDGEDFVGAGPAAAARALAAGHVVHCLGFGRRSGSKVVVDSEQGEVFLRDAAGDEVLTALLPDALRDVATAGGGLCQLGTDVDLTALYAGTIRPRALQLAVAAAELEPRHWHPWCLLLAFACGMLATWLPFRRPLP